MSRDNSPITHRVLVVDDNQAIHEDFRKILSPSTGGQTISAAEAALFGGDVPIQQSRPTFDVESALQGQDGVAMVALALAEGRPYSLAFIDMRMPPGWDGLKTIEELWKVDREVQIVICSAYSDYDWVEVLERLGSSDQLLILKKPTEPIEILQAASALSCKWQNARMLKRYVDGLEQVVTERTQGLEAANQQLRYLASHDPLTGLPNRVLLDDRLGQAIALAEREQQQFAVLLVDLDRFKTVNDSLGHRAGDDLLKEVARRLSSVIRGADTLARLGGDEFVVVVSLHENSLSPEQLAERMIAALEPPMRLLGVDVHTAASIGIAIYPADGNTAQALMARADAAMYCAKERGGHAAQCHREGMKAGDHDRLKIESELRQALSLRQFELHYQPKADIATGEVHSAEALIRWRHPQAGLLLPDAFLGIADECGLIDAIGEWVVFEACRQAKIWQQEGIRPLRVAINLAPSQFRLTNLVSQISSALQAAQLDARYLEVELTESAVMSRPEESAAILEAVSRMGVLVSVDDFGTGYSSLSYLRRFPIDKLKIDRIFVQEITTHAQGASIVQAIVSLAHSLGLKVVAEGVETAEQLQFLQRLGCDQYQGFQCSPALPVAEFAALMRAQAPLGGAVFSDDEASRTHSKLAVHRAR